MNYLDKWLESIERHLDSVSSEDMERTYLSVRSEGGVRIKDYLIACYLMEIYSFSYDENQFSFYEIAPVKVNAANGLRPAFSSVDYDFNGALAA